VQYNRTYLEELNMTKKQFEWKKFILGAKRPLIAMIGFGLTWLAGQPEWAWVGGITAERVWSTIEFYLTK
jgi:hypothetical protein